MAERSASSPGAITRRRFLQTTGLLGVSGLVTGGAGLGIGAETPGPTGTRATIPGTAFGSCGR